jgi:hypothetical protein
MAKRRAPTDWETVNAAVRVLQAAGVRVRITGTWPVRSAMYHGPRDRAGARVTLVLENVRYVDEERIEVVDG